MSADVLWGGIFLIGSVLLTAVLTKWISSKSTGDEREHERAMLRLELESRRRGDLAALRKEVYLRFYVRVSKAVAQEFRASMLNLVEAGDDVRECYPLWAAEWDALFEELKESMAEVELVGTSDARDGFEVVWPVVRALGSAWAGRGGSMLTMDDRARVQDLLGTLRSDLGLALEEIGDGSPMVAPSLEVAT